METFEELIRRIVSNFNDTELDYMFTGAVAASYYGTPRTTMDADVIVRIAKQEMQRRLVPALRNAGLQVDKKKIDKAIESGFKIVTVKDCRSPFTLDLIFADKKLKKRAGTILDLPTFFQTPEELILAKLRMIKATIPRERASKDKEDIRAILRFAKVEVNALRKQAQENSTSPILDSIIGAPVSARKKQKQ